MATEIKNFGLYGREASTVSPEFIHLVTIDSSCRKHNWIIKPHFHTQLYQFFFIESGSGEFIFNEKSRRFEGRNLIIMPENNLHGFQFSEDIKGYTLSISSYIIEKVIENDKELANEIGRVRLLNLNQQAEEDFADMMMTVNSLKREQTQQLEKKDSFVKSLLTLLFIKMYRLRTKIKKESEYIGASRELMYYKAFMRELKSQVPTNRNLDDYTKVLGISKTHLNRVCQSTVGKPSNQVIADYLINESMILLSHTELTVSEIAHQLEFKDLSYFCRFFKKQVGSSPAKFREEHSNIDEVPSIVAVNF